MLCPPPHFPVWVLGAWREQAGRERCAEVAALAAGTGQAVAPRCRLPPTGHEEPALIPCASASATEAVDHLQPWAPGRGVGWGTATPSPGC